MYATKSNENLTKAKWEVNFDEAKELQWDWRVNANFLKKTYLIISCENICNTCPPQIITLLADQNAIEWILGGKKATSQVFLKSQSVLSQFVTRQQSKTYIPCP